VDAQARADGPPQFRGPPQGFPGEHAYMREKSLCKNVHQMRRNEKKVKKKEDELRTRKSEVERKEREIEEKEP
jgi:hypothetical protein